MFNAQGSMFKTVNIGNRKYFFLHTLFILSVAILVLALTATASLSADRPLKPFLWGFALDGYPITAQKMKKIELETGLMPDITVFFMQWPSPENKEKVNFPLESLETIWNRGAVPCITWEPMYYKDSREIAIPYNNILNGSYDYYINSFAKQAKLFGKPFMIRFAHEMNIRRYHWGTDEKHYGPGSPAIYKRMFQYIVSSFRKTGANNILWVFCPNAESVPNTSYDKTALWNTIENYYPGNDFVDILGIDGYNWGTTQKKERHGWDSSWRSFNEIFKSAFSELKAIDSKKDIIIFETSTVNQGGAKSLWIKETLETAGKWELTGIVWFQANKEQDWRLTMNDNGGNLKTIRTFRSQSHKWFEGILKRD